MGNRLEDILGRIVEASKGEPPSSEDREAIHEVVWRNELDEDENVPDWLIDLFERTLAAQTTEWTSFPREGYSFSDVFTFIAELEDAVDVEYEHREESIALTFTSLGVEAIIWLESAQYRVSPILNG